MYERAIGIDSKDAGLKNNYGYSLSERGIQLDYAVQLVDEALAIDPENGSFMDTKGWILYQQKNYKSALEWISKSVDVRDSSAAVWEHLGDVNEKLGDMEAARKAWEKALALDKTKQSLLDKLGK